MDMDCPKCHEPMAHNPIGETAIDVCPTCRGIWFDSGEIDALKGKVAPDQSWLEFEYWHRKGKFHVMTDVLYCPRCAGTAMTLIYDKVSETSLRYCAKCGGSWMTAADFAGVNCCPRCRVGPSPSRRVFKRKFGAGERMGCR
jgi:Zn-finger nucleic acid-binding protein